MKWRFLVMVLLMLPVMASWAENRFPQPQFENGYAMPVTTTPPPRASILEALDVVVLAGALAASAWLVLRARSRRGVLLLTIFSLIYFGFWRRGCICPVGSIQNMVAWGSDAGAVLPLSVALFFILPLIFALFFGRVFCAAVCPLGSIQELVVLHPVRLPRNMVLALGVVPLIYLGLAILMASTGAGFLICRYDPFVSIFRLSGSVPMVVAGILLLLLGLVIARPYCRFLCPYGVLLNWMSRLSKWRVSITPNDCIQCRLCETCCPYDAIRMPSVPVAESREAGVRRLKGLLLLLPVLAFMGWWIGSHLDNALVSLHPKGQLAQALAGKDGAASAAFANEIEAFRVSGTTPETLNKEVDTIRHKMRLGAGILGAFLGTVLGVSMIGVSVRRSRTIYEPDQGECLACARCYESCPKEHERWDGVAIGCDNSVVASEYSSETDSAGRH